MEIYGNADVSGQVTSPMSSLLIEAGQANFHGNNLLISGLLTLTGGATLLSRSTTTAAGGIAISGNPGLDGGTLVNLGAATESGALRVYDGADIDNKGSWEFASDGVIGWNGGAAPVFTNEGQVVADAGTSNTGINIRFVNTQAIAVHAGTFVLGNTNDPGTSSSTTNLTTDPGANLHLYGNFQVSGNIQTNNITFEGGTFTVAGALTANPYVYNFANVSVAGPYLAGSTSVYRDAQLTLNGPVLAMGDVSVDYGSGLTLNPVTPETMALNSLTIGSGTLSLFEEDLREQTRVSIQPSCWRRQHPNCRQSSSSRSQ